MKSQESQFPLVLSSFAKHCNVKNHTWKQYPAIHLFTLSFCIYRKSSISAYCWQHRFESKKRELRQVEVSVIQIWGYFRLSALSKNTLHKVINNLMAFLLFVFNVASIIRVPKQVVKSILVKLFGFPLDTITTATKNITKFYYLNHQHSHLFNI